MYRILILADIVMLAVFGLLYSRLPPQMPLFYSHPWGEEQIVDIWYLALIPILLHLFYFLNLFLLVKIFKRDATVRNITSTMNMFLIISFTFIFVRILLTIT